MTETTPPPARRLPTAPAVGARALIAAALTVVAIFSPDRSPAFGLLVLGCYLVVQAVVLVAGATGLALSRAGRGLVVLRGLVSLGGGVVALVSVGGGGLAALRGVEVWVFLILGLLEIVGGLRRTELPDIAGDAIVVGGLQALVGVMLVILNPDVLFSIGVLGAWGAVVAVYLGISCANLLRRGRGGR